MSDLIKREDAIEAIDKMICDNKWVCECAINSLPSAEPQGELIGKADAIAYIDRVTNSGLGRRKSLEYIRKYIVELPSAEAVQGWIPVSERLPDELAAVKWVKFVHDVLYEDKDEKIREALNMAIEALKERPHGEWIKQGNTLICPICGAKGEEIKDDYCFNYCPVCGADMRGEEE